jgi:hypothetical protein
MLEVLKLEGVQITREQAQQFESLRKSGICNMLGGNQYLGFPKRVFIKFITGNNYDKIMNHYKINTG